MSERNIVSSSDARIPAPPCVARHPLIDRDWRESSDGRRFLAAYFPVNDPLMPLSRLSAYDAAQVDVVELGVKARNPFADGPIIHSAMDRASGIGQASEAMDAIKAVREFSHPAFGMIFGYQSDVFAAQPEVWAEVDGLLCLGQDENARLAVCRAAQAQGTRITEFVPYEMPLSSRTAAINADSYVMLQYLPGRTGARSEVDQLLAPRLAKMRRAGVARPILTGIGISQPDQVRHAIDTGADGIVIGSKVIAMGVQSHAALEDYLCGIREVLDGG